MELPEGTDVDALFDAAARARRAFVKGTDFVLEGGENTLRLAYSGVTAAQIEEGVRASPRRPARWSEAQHLARQRPR